jgi:thiazole synthase
LYPRHKGLCLPFDTALKVVLESRTGCLVYHVPTDVSSVQDVAGYTWSFSDLLNALPIDEYILLSNTSRASTAEQAVNKANDGLALFSKMRHAQKQTKPAIKLEVLSVDLNSVDNEVLRATEILIKDGFDVLPLVSPKEASIEACVALGVPVIRLLVGQIGSMSGFTNKKQLSQLVSRIPTPVFFEGGLGSVNDVREAIQLGAYGVLLNTAIRRAKDPIAFVKDVRKVLDAGKERGLTNCSSPQLG